MPNTVVKPLNAESTWLEAAREDRKSPVRKTPVPFGIGVFLFKHKEER